MQHYMIKFVSDLLQVCGFLRPLWFPPPIKTDCHDIAEILLKVALNTRILTPPPVPSVSITNHHDITKILLKYIIFETPNHAME